MFSIETLLIFSWLVVGGQGQEIAIFDGLYCSEEEIF
jgi:hypothetical protein